MTKVALVTGASSGIGAAVAQRLASMGMKTYVAARRIEKMESLQDLGARVLRLDLTDEHSIGGVEGKWPGSCRM
jgi:NADP-dependent 3-hydroxy acid dehydrogenase YdfG